MVRTVYQIDVEVNGLVSCQNTALGSFFDTCFDCGNIFFRNTSSDCLIDKRKAFARFVWRNNDFTVTVLTFTARLSLEESFGVDGVAYRFAVSNLRRAYVGFDLEFSLKSVNDYIQVQFAHTCNNRLTGLLVGISLEGRVFFCKFLQSKSHFFLSCLCFRLDSDLNNGVREFHRLQNDRSAFVAKRVASGSVFKTYDSNNIACVSFVYFGTAVGVHSYQTTYSFSLIFCGIINVRTFCQYAGIYAEESKLSDKRVGCDFKCKSAEFFLVGRIARNLIVFFAGSITCNVGNVGRRRQIVDDSVKQKLRALIAKRSAAECGSNLHLDSCFSDDRLQQRLWHSFYADVTLKEFLHKFVIEFGNFLYQSGS